MQPTHSAVLTGRVLDFYTHTCGPEFGYDKERSFSFAVLHPRNEQPDIDYPLDVVFHSAGHNMYSTLSCLYQEGNHDIYHTPDDMFGLFPDCMEHAGETTDWWWGGRDALLKRCESPERAGTALQPVEKRCIAEIEWVLDHFSIDRNRVYGVGNSMGGSGCLGIALRRGDIFAALKVNVPAGVRHAADRCCLDAESSEGSMIPDPPIVIDYSAQNDNWSTGHELLYESFARKKYQIFGFWGPFGHANNHNEIAKVNDLIHSVNVWSFRKNEAYPVFTHASTDDPIPWPERSDEKSGQVNAFFRWNIIADTVDRFEVELRLLRSDEWDTRITLPSASVTDITFRRIQCFRIASGESLILTYDGNDSVVCANEYGLPVLERLTVTTQPTRLVLTRKV